MFFSVLYVTWIVLIGYCSSHAQLEEVAAKSAGNDCEHGLATYDDFKSKFANLSVLKNGQSGWLSGFADLSPALSVESCFDATNVDINRSLTIDSRENILDKCIKSCSGYPYIGLQNNTCFCLERNELHIENRIRLPECQRACQTIFNFNCEKYLIIYRKSNTQSYHGVGQCVYIFKNTTGTVLNDSASCHTVSGINMHGYICLYHKQSQLSEFLVENANLPTWTEAYNHCASKNSSLISMAYSTNFSTLVPGSNKKYWIGVFRTISPVSESSSNTCLAVTKVESNYFLDIDDCRTAKVPICSARSSYIHTTTFSKFRSTTEALIQPEKPSSGSNQVTVVVGLTSGILVVAVIVVCIVRRIKARKTSNSNRTLIIHGNDKITVSGTDDYATVDEDLQAEPSKSKTVTKNTKNNPMKPEGQALRCQSKNVHAGSIQDSTYDRVDLTRPNHHNDRNTPSNADLNIYDHTVHDANIYDVTMMRQKIFANKVYDASRPESDQIYNTTNTESIQRGSKH